MKITKRLITIAVCVSMIICLCACGGNNLAEHNTETVSSATVIETTTVEETTKQKSIELSELMDIYKEQIVALSKNDSQDYETCYAVSDIDGDNIPELFVEQGADGEGYKLSIYIYDFDENSVALIESMSSKYYMGLYKMKDNSLMWSWGHMGHEEMKYYTLADKKLTLKSQSEREVGVNEDFTEGDYYINFVKAANFSEFNKFRNGRCIDKLNLMSFINENIDESSMSLRGLAALMEFDPINDDISDTEHKNFAFPAEQLYQNDESTVAVVSSDYKLFCIETSNTDFCLDGVLIGDSMEEAKNVFMEQNNCKSSPYIQRGDASDPLSGYEFRLDTETFGTLFIYITGGDTVKNICISTNNA